MSSESLLTSYKRIASSNSICVVIVHGSPAICKNNYYLFNKRVYKEHKNEKFKDLVIKSPKNNTWPASEHIKIAKKFHLI